MGDRSSSQFLIPRSIYFAHQAVIDEILSAEMSDESEGHALVTLICEDRQGGGYEENMALELAEIPHLHYWAPGIEYHAGAEAFIPGENGIEVQAVGDVVVVSYDEEHQQACEEDLADAKAFAEFKRRIIGLNAMPAENPGHKDK